MDLCDIACHHIGNDPVVTTAKWLTANRGGSVWLWTYSSRQSDYPPELVSLQSFTIALTDSKSYSSPVTDPFDQRNHGALQTVEFYDYREPVASAVIIDIIKQATSHSLGHPGSAFITTNQLQFWSGEVQLILYPGEHLTWQMWSEAIASIFCFVKKKGMAFGWIFFILEDGESRMCGRTQSNALCLCPNVMSSGSNSIC